MSLLDRREFLNLAAKSGMALLIPYWFKLLPLKLEEQLDREFIDLANHLNFTETPSPEPDRQVLPWTADEKQYVANDAYITARTMWTTDVHLDIIRRVMKYTHIARIAGNLSYSLYGRVELASPGAIIHELAHQLLDVEIDNHQWRGLMEASAEWFQNKAIGREMGSPGKFHGCGARAGEYDYFEGAKAFEAVSSQLKGLGRPSLFGSLANIYNAWVNEAPNGRLGYPLPAEILIQRLAQTYRTNEAHIQNLFRQYPPFQC